MKKTSLIVASFVLAITALIFTGCGTTPPGAFENYLFTSVTNYVPQVVTVTNTFERVETETNAVTGAVTINPIREIVIMSQTNSVGTVETKPSAAFQSWSGLLSGVANGVSPGSGSAIGVGLLGLAGWFGMNRQKKLTAAVRARDGYEEQADTMGTLAENFAQSIEVFREVVKASPNGAALDGKFVEMLRNNQLTVGLVTEAITLVKGSVDSESAKRAADKILAQIPELKRAA